MSGLLWTIITIGAIELVSGILRVWFRVTKGPAIYTMIGGLLYPVGLAVWALCLVLQ